MSQNIKSSGGFRAIFDSAVLLSTFSSALLVQSINLRNTYLMPYNQEPINFDFHRDPISALHFYAF